MLITGAAGNMGTLLSRHLAGRVPRLRLMYHRRPLAADVLCAEWGYRRPWRVPMWTVQTGAAACEMFALVDEGAADSWWRSGVCRIGEIRAAHAQI